jgi:hypothetical protein
LPPVLGAGERVGDAVRCHRLLPRVSSRRAPPFA